MRYVVWEFNGWYTSFYVLKSNGNWFISPESFHWPIVRPLVDSNNASFELALMRRIKILFIRMSHVSVIHRESRLKQAVFSPARRARAVRQRSFSCLFRGITLLVFAFSPGLLCLRSCPVGFSFLIEMSKSLCQSIKELNSSCRLRCRFHTSVLMYKHVLCYSAVI